ncbi:hypothetical protein RJZ56_006130 [Blastomyces dermatitidis]
MLKNSMSALISTPSFFLFSTVGPNLPLNWRINDAHGPQSKSPQLCGSASPTATATATAPVAPILMSISISTKLLITEPSAGFPAHL